MFVYDALGRAQKVQYPDGREVSYTYGNRKRPADHLYPGSDQTVLQPSGAHRVKPEPEILLGWERGSV